jgi:hypothetical protein
MYSEDKSNEATRSASKSKNQQIYTTPMPEAFNIVDEPLLPVVEQATVNANEPTTKLVRFLVFH